MYVFIFRTALDDEVLREFRVGDGTPDGTSGAAAWYRERWRSILRYLLFLPPPGSKAQRERAEYITYLTIGTSAHLSLFSDTRHPPRGGTRGVNVLRDGDGSESRYFF